MTYLPILFLTTIFLSFIPTGKVYKKIQSGGKNPWPWAIVTFLTSFILIGMFLFWATRNMKWER